MEILLTHNQGKEWPWSQVDAKYTTRVGLPPKSKANLNLAAVVVHED